MRGQAERHGACTHAVLYATGRVLMDGLFREVDGRRRVAALPPEMRT